MKKKTKVLSGIALGLLVVLGVSVYASGGALQGKFGIPVQPSVTMEIASSSPSGNHSVSVADEMMGIAVSPKTSTTLPVGSTITFNFYGYYNVASSTSTTGTPVNTVKDITFTKVGNIAVEADGETVFLKASGTTIGTGTISVVDAFTATATVTTTSEVTLPATLILSLDSTKLFAKHTGYKDFMTVSASYANVSTVVGNTLTY